MESIHIADLRFAYGDHELFSDCNLKVSQGEFVVLRGENGSGKSTLLQLMLYRLKNYEGSIRLLGIDSKHRQDWSEIAFIEQNAAANHRNFPATAYEIVKMYAYQSFKDRLSNGKRRGMTPLEALRSVGLEEKKHSLFGKLSGGQQQRVLLATLLLNDHKLIILDEPTIGLDQDAMQSFYRLLFRINREQKITFFVVSHDRQLQHQPEVTTYALHRGTLQKFHEKGKTDGNISI